MDRFSEGTSIKRPYKKADGYSGNKHEKHYQVIPENLTCSGGSSHHNHCTQEYPQGSPFSRINDFLPKLKKKR